MSEPLEIEAGDFKFRQVGWYGPYGLIPGGMDNDAADHWRPVYVETSAPLYKPAATFHLLAQVGVTTACFLGRHATCSPRPSCGCDCHVTASQPNPT